MSAGRRLNGEGTLYFRSGRRCWVAQVTDGNRRVTQEFKSKAQARAWLQEMGQQIQAGLDLDDARMTLAELLEYYLEFTAGSRAPKTFEQYRQVTDRFILPEIGTLRLMDIKPRVVSRYLLGLHRRGESPRQIQIVRVVLNQAFKLARREGFPYNPVEGSYRPRYEAPEIRPLSAEQSQRFRSAIRGHPLEALFYLAIGKGIREGELLGLQWKDIDPDVPALIVQRQAQRVKGQGLVLRTTKTRHGQRILVLGDEDLRLLAEQRARVAAMREKAGADWQEQDMLFCTPVGAPLDQSNLTKRFRKILKLARLPVIRFHDLRHTFATLALLQGVHPKIVSEMLGHGDIDITLRLYSHVVPSLQAGVAARMDTLLNQDAEINAEESE